ncbi:ThiF family adenylyltransferase [bacterium]|nr:MAG: ThiF family adenylyltransferase [bacterium]
MNTIVDPFKNWPIVSNVTAIDDEERGCTVYTASHDVEIDFSQQTGWFDPNKYVGGVTIIGAGGIGCNVAFELLTMGVKDITLYDHDDVEPHNLASQKAYRLVDLGKPKVRALARLLLEYGADTVTVYQRRFTGDDVITTPLVIGAVDSMASRQLIWDAITNSPNVQFYLDGRLNKQTAQICAVEPFDPDWYTKTWLFPDEMAPTDATCTMRTVVFPATAMAAIMCRHISRWFLGQPVVQFAQFDLDEFALTVYGDIE